MNDDSVDVKVPESVAEVLLAASEFKEKFQGALRVNEFISLAQASIAQAIQLVDTQVEFSSAYGAAMYGGLVAVMNMYDFQLDGEEEMLRNIMLVMDDDESGREYFGDNVPMIADEDALWNPTSAALDSIHSMKMNADGVTEDLELNVDEVVHFGVLGIAVIYAMFIASRRGRAEVMLAWPITADLAIEMSNMLYLVYNDIAQGINQDETQED